MKNLTKIKIKKDINQEIINLSEKLLKEKSKKALAELAKLMDYQWPRNQPDYIAIPTILPFSPDED